MPEDLAEMPGGITPGKHRNKFAESFLENVRKKFGDKFLLHKVEYINSSTKVIIVCRDHDEFTMTPNNLLHSKHACPKCRSETPREYLKTTAEFIAKATLLHGDIYDYSKTLFVKLSDVVVITCPKHGDFEQIADLHLKKCGCKNCTLSQGTLRYSQTSFLEAAKLIHGDRYDYSETVFKNGHSPVTIICQRHGQFQQEASGHLTGSTGCRQCYLIENTKTIDDFVQQAREKHGMRYDYSKSTYEHSNSKLCITCAKHGDFWQLARSHLSGSGCYKCWTRSSKMAIGWLDFTAIQIGFPIQHAENGGEFFFPFDRRQRADGYCLEIDTVFEFNGDLWHGNPDVFDQSKKNPFIDKTYGELYAKTVAREQLIRDNGFNLVVMWEFRWVKGLKAVKKLQKIWRKSKKVKK